MSETSENRTRVLPPEVKIELCRLSGLGVDEAGSSILELLPDGLTPREVDSIGLQVLTLTETVAPSNPFVSRGAKIERDVIRSIGFAAAASGDTQTAESSISHLKKDKLSLTTWLAVGLIRWELMRRSGVEFPESESQV